MRSPRRTHARGHPAPLDAQERAEKQRRQRQALETQRIIQQQVRASWRKRFVLKEQRRGGHVGAAGAPGEEVVNAVVSPQNVSRRGGELPLHVYGL